MAKTMEIIQAIVYKNTWVLCSMVLCKESYYGNTPNIVCTADCMCFKNVLWSFNGQF